MLVVRVDDDSDAQLKRLANQRARTKSAFVEKHSNMSSLRKRWPKAQLTK
jgi:predicted transcriptional regulator